MKRLVLPIMAGLLSVCLLCASASSQMGGNQCQCPTNSQCPDYICCKDPLQGMDLLAPIDEVVIAWDKGEPMPFAKIHDVSPADQLIGKGWLFDRYFALDGERTLDVATGDFNNDQRDEIAWIWQSYGSTPILSILQADDNLELGVPCDSWYTGETIYGNAHIAVVTGDFDGDLSHEIAISWPGAGDFLGPHKTNVKLYDVDHQLCPQPKDKKYDESLGNGTQEWLDLAASDFDGDGKDEVVLLWEGKEGSIPTANLKFYDVDPSLTLLPITSTMVSPLAGGEHMVVAAGDVDGDFRAEIAVAWEISETTGVFLGLAVYSIQPTAAGAGRLTWVEQGRKLFTDDMVNNMTDLAIATGDLDGKGDDEIVVSFAGSDAMVHTFVVDFVNTGYGWQLDPKYHDRNQDIQGAMHLDLAVGQFDDRDLQHEVVLALEADRGWICLNFYDISRTDGFSFIYKDGRCEELLGGNKNLAIAAGNFDREGFWLGPKTPASPQCSRTGAIIAYIGEPPKHEDEINSQHYNINNNPNSYVRYMNEQQQTTDMELTTWSDLGISAALEGAYTTITWYVQARFGVHFERHTEQVFRRVQHQEWGRSTTAQSDDVLVRVDNNFAVWEYPVYSPYRPITEPIGTRLIGHIAVVVPYGTPTTIVLDGKNPAAYSYYLPSHENGDALSYPSTEPEDIGTRIKCSEAYYLGVNPISTWVKWSDVAENASAISSTVSLDFAVQGGGWGPIWGGIGVISATVEGKYNYGQIANYLASFQESSSLFLHLAPITDENQSYLVQPYFYWSNKGPLVVDYAVEPVTSEAGFPPTWWDDVYTKPNLTFNLPWRWETDQRKFFSKEIVVSPKVVTVGEIAIITAKIHNYSLKPAENVVVRFQQGCSENPSPGEDRLIPYHLDPRASAVISATVPVVAAGSIEAADAALGHRMAIVTQAGVSVMAESPQISVVVDPYSAISETNETDNRACRELVIKSASSPPGDVYVLPEDITISSVTPDAVQLRARVRAQYGPVAYVLAEFYEGNPQRRGVFIGAALIPLILPGEAKLAEVSWDVNGRFGEHEIYVVLSTPPGEDSNLTNNTATRHIQVTPLIHYYLPLVLKESIR
jgi:hypothetical protein